jgi:hypothetical protein
MHPSELSVDQQRKLLSIIREAQRFPALRDMMGNVIEDAFLQTAKRGKNKVASRIAKELFNLHEEVNYPK